MLKEVEVGQSVVAGLLAEDSLVNRKTQDATEK